METGSDKMCELIWWWWRIAIRGAICANSSVSTVAVKNFTSRTQTGGWWSVNVDLFCSVHCDPSRQKVTIINKICNDSVPDIGQVAVIIDLFNLLLWGILESPTQTVQVHVFLPQVPGEVTLQLLQLGLKICVCITVAETEREHVWGFTVRTGWNRRAHGMNTMKAEWSQVRWRPASGGAGKQCWGEGHTLIGLTLWPDCGQVVGHGRMDWLCLSEVKAESHGDSWITD